MVDKKVFGMKKEGIVMKPKKVDVPVKKGDYSRFQPPVKKNVVVKKKAVVKNIAPALSKRKVVDKKARLPQMPKPHKEEVSGEAKPRVFQTEKEKAMDFAVKVQEKFDRLVKASVLFGSQVRNEAEADSDIDIILIVDDVATNWDLELVAWYREELGKLISRQEYGNELHINTVRLSTWWEDLLHGDPVVINILRYGEALIDYGGFYNPLKALLLKGKIRSTPEAVHAALMRVPGHIARSKAAEMGAIEGVYWAMIDSAQAALMTAGKIPPSPEHIPEMLKTTFVDAGMLKMKYVKAIREIYAFHKSIIHGQVSDIKGQDIDEWQDMSEKFLLEITQIIDGMLDRQEEE